MLLSFCCTFETGFRDSVDEFLESYESKWDPGFIANWGNDQGN